MKPQPKHRRGPIRYGQTIWRGRRGHWAQPVLFILALLTPVHVALTLSGAYGPDPIITGMVHQGMAAFGVAAFVALLLWWGVTGFSGYEHWVGLRIVLRPGAAPVSRVPILVIGGIAAVGMLLMVYGVRSATIAIIIAVCTLVALMLWLLRHFAVSATLSIIGIAIGVAALIVVQSVATGFQHEFERRVLGRLCPHQRHAALRDLANTGGSSRTCAAVEGVKGASPFVYYAMALAPVARARSWTQTEGTFVAPPRAGQGDRALDRRRGDRSARSISPRHSKTAMGEPRPRSRALVTDLALQPMPDRDDDRLPPVDRRNARTRAGEDWYPKRDGRLAQRCPSTRSSDAAGRSSRTTTTTGRTSSPIDENTAEDEAATATDDVRRAHALARELELERRRRRDAGRSRRELTITRKPPSFGGIASRGCFEPAFRNTTSRLDLHPHQRAAVLQVPGQGHRLRASTFGWLRPLRGARPSKPSYGETIGPTTSTRSSSGRSSTPTSSSRSARRRRS